MTIKRICMFPMFVPTPPWSAGALGCDSSAVTEPCVTVALLEAMAHRWASQ